MEFVLADCVDKVRSIDISEAILPTQERMHKSLDYEGYIMQWFNLQQQILWWNVSIFMALTRYEVLNEFEQFILQDPKFVLLVPFKFYSYIFNVAIEKKQL